MLRGSCKRQPGRADVSVLQGFSSVPRDCTSTGMYPGTNSLESRWKIIVTKFYFVFLGAAIQAFSWSLGWWFSLHQCYSLALVVVFVCKSDLKVVLRRAKSRNKRYESCFTQRKVKMYSAAWAEEKHWVLQSLERLITSGFLGMLISWIFILLPWIWVKVCLQINCIKVTLYLR